MIWLREKKNNKIIDDSAYMGTFFTYLISLQKEKMFSVLYYIDAICIDENCIPTLSKSLLNSYIYNRCKIGYYINWLY